jgi:BCD family chlorophyll transporter-like MFS transporter
MNRPLTSREAEWAALFKRMMPFADAATTDLPLGRLIRLSLFQVSVGMTTVLLIGTLNRVMIVEMAMPASLVAVMVALPLLFAPFRTLVGFRSDHHASAFGWRRVPYLWFGTLMQFAGLGFMPFALIVMSGDTWGPVWIGYAASALAFLLAGAGLQTTQTAGLALATDLAPPQARPRVVALMYTMLLLGMAGSGAVFALFLSDYNPVKLIQVVQGAAVAAAAINLVALWKQESRDSERARAFHAGEMAVAPPFAEVWARFTRTGRAKRYLLAVALGTAAFNMQDVVLEPYGGEVLKLSVAETTALTVMMALGALTAFALAARQLMAGQDPLRIAAYGLVVGLAAFAFVTLSAPLHAPTLFRIGVVLIGFGGGLFSVGTLTAAMALDRDSGAGLALGAWGAVQALALGVSVAFGGVLRDVVSKAAQAELFGPAFTDISAGYTAVYHIEILLLFATLIVIGPLVGRKARPETNTSPQSFGLAEFPG